MRVDRLLEPSITHPKSEEGFRHWPISRMMTMTRLRIRQVMRQLVRRRNLEGHVQHVPVIHRAEGFTRHGAHGLLEMLRVGPAREGRVVAQRSLGDCGTR